MKCPEYANLERKTVDWWLPGDEGIGRKWEVTVKGYRVSFVDDKNVHQIDCGCAYTKNH